MWEQTYLRGLTTENLFSLQAELTEKIIRSLEAGLMPEEEERLERRSTAALDAYRLYALARALLNQRTDPMMRRATDHFQQAIALDPTNAIRGAAWPTLIPRRPVPSSTRGTVPPPSARCWPDTRKGGTPSPPASRVRRWELTTRSWTTYAITTGRTASST